MDHSGKLMRQADSSSYFELFSTFSTYISDFINGVLEKVSRKRKHVNAFSDQNADDKPLENNVLPHPHADSSEEYSLKEPPTKKRKLADTPADEFVNIEEPKVHIFTAIKKPPLNIRLRMAPTFPQNHRRFSNSVTNDRLLSPEEQQQKEIQDKKDKALYAFEDRGFWNSGPLTHIELQQIEALLIAGANPNYVPPQNEYRMPAFEPCSLIITAIHLADIALFNLLLKHNANIFQESKSANPIVWNALTRVITSSPSMIKPEYVIILNTILGKLETTLEEVSKNLHGTDIGIIPLREFVENMKKSEKSNISSLRA